MFDTSKTVTEPERTISVLSEVDVVVVGGGPAGVAASIAAARNGASVALVERYGYVGGMATGGLVILLDSMSDDSGRHVIKGIAQEIVDRLDVMGGVVYPPKEAWGSDDLRLVRRWKRWGAVAGGKHVRYSPVVNPEYFKVLGNRMLDEVGVDTFFHAWVCSALVKDNETQGVVLESKSGRQAILAKVTVDCTGDGDVFAFAGAEFEQNAFPPGLVFRVGGVDTKRADDFEADYPEKFKELMTEMTYMGGVKGGIVEQKVAPGGNYMHTTIDSVVWFNNSLPRTDVLNVRDLSRVEKEVREQMMITLEFFKERIPGFEKAFLFDTAPQLGTRASRRLKGEHELTREEMLSGESVEDVIATVASGVDGRPLIDIPYRCLLPDKVDNLLVAGRCISTDFVTQTIIRIIPSCMATGQAAGTAAAVAIKEKQSPRGIDRSHLQETLSRDGLFLRQDS